YDLHDEYLDNTLDYMDRHQIKYVWGYPGSLYFLANRALERGWNQPLCGVGTWGDNLYGHYRKRIEQAFRTNVINMYGCGEGVWIAAQCGFGSHLHVFNTDVVLEYLDEDHNPVPPGQIGSLAVTRLHPGPMPLIRYQLGDIGVSSDAPSCE